MAILTSLERNFGRYADIVGRRVGERTAANKFCLPREDDTLEPRRLPQTKNKGAIFLSVASLRGQAISVTFLPDKSKTVDRKNKIWPHESNCNTPCSFASNFPSDSVIRYVPNF